MLSVLRQLGQLEIVGADVVEVAPAYDHADITAIAGSTVAQHYLGLLAERKARLADMNNNGAAGLNHGTGI
jgi:agmatinase